MAKTFKEIVFRNEYQLEKTELFLEEADRLLDRLNNEFASAVQDTQGEGADQYRDDYLDHIGYENGLLMDAAIGAALVVAQAFITAMKTSCRAQGALTWAQGSSWQSDVMTVPIGGNTTIVDIHGLANYFKHHDEWDQSWFSVTSPTAPDSRSKAAVAVAKKYGANHLGQVDLVQAMTSLSSDAISPKGYDLRRLGMHLRTWQAQITALARQAKVFD